MVIVVGEFRLPPECLDEARPMMAAVIAATRAEDGCQAYAYAEDVLDPGLIRVSERWDSRAQLNAHLTMPHMALWAQQRAGLGLTGRHIVVHEVSSSEEV